MRACMSLSRVRERRGASCCGAWRVEPRRRCVFIGPNNSLFCSHTFALRAARACSYPHLSHAPASHICCPARAGCDDGPAAAAPPPAAATAMTAAPPFLHESKLQGERREIGWKRVLSLATPNRNDSNDEPSCHGLGSVAPLLGGLCSDPGCQRCAQNTLFVKAPL